MTDLLVITALVAVLVAVLAPYLVARRRERRYRRLLAVCLERQPDHEREHHAQLGLVGEPGYAWNTSLRLLNLVNRFERGIHAAGLPMLPRVERLRRARTALLKERP